MLNWVTVQGSRDEYRAAVSLKCNILQGFSIKLIVVSTLYQYHIIFTIYINQCNHFEPY